MINAVHCFHCDPGKYVELRNQLSFRWILCNWVFTRNEWHITAINRKFFESLPHEKRERVMTQLSYANKGDSHANIA